MTTQTQPKQLPGVWELIVDSWHFFTSTWNTTIKVSIFFLYAGLAIFLATLLLRSGHGFLFIFFMQLLVLIVVSILLTWAIIRLTWLMLRLDENKKPMDAKEGKSLAWKLLFPYFWIYIIINLVTFGGFILLIIPGIYFTIALSMSAIFLVDKGYRGFQTLAASEVLIKDRWWPIFWRFIAGGSIFGTLIMAAFAVLTFIVSLVTGPEFFMDVEEYALLPYGVEQFLQLATLAVFMPLMVGFHVKVYRALQATR